MLLARRDKSTVARSATYERRDPSVLHSIAWRCIRLHGFARLPSIAQAWWIPPCDALEFLANHSTTHLPQNGLLNNHQRHLLVIFGPILSKVTLARPWLIVVVEFGWNVDCKENIILFWKKKKKERRKHRRPWNLLSTFLCTKRRIDSSTTSSCLLWILQLFFYDAM